MALASTRNLIHVENNVRAPLNRTLPPTLTVLRLLLYTVQLLNCGLTRQCRRRIII